MDDDGDVHEHLRNFFDTIDKLNEMEIEINKHLLTVMLLYSLPPSYENFRCAIESRDELPDPEMLRVKIVEEHDARKHGNQDKSPNAMLVKKKFGKPRNAPQKGDREKCVSEQKSEPFKFKCHRCEKVGHKAADCRISKENKGNANVAKDFCLNAYVTDLNDMKALGSSESQENKSWCLDSVCSTLMANDEAYFVSEIQPCAGNVKLASEKSILTASRREGLYYVQEANNVSEKNLNIEIEKRNNNETTAEWHMKMGHLNIRDLFGGDRNGKVHGLNLGNVIDIVNCEICLSEKMTIIPFPKTSNRSTKVLEIIHTDVCGPMRVAFVGKGRFIATFIDDYSRWCQIYIFKRKSEVLSVFKEFKAEVEKKDGCKIQFIQSDNEKEYVNTAFDQFLKENGIRRRLTTTHTPQQNGDAERRNLTLLNMTRCLLKQSSLPLGFWAKPINTSNHTLCPSKSIGGMTSYEKWNGQVPDVSYFQIFGSEAYTLNRSPTKGKLESRAKKGIFDGYSQE